MPEPTPFKKSEKPKEEKNLPVPVVSNEIIEPRCHVCVSKYRRAIDRMLALGTSYSEISRIFGGEIDRRSISNHDKNHLNYEDAAIRRIIEREIEDAQENVEDGIQGVVTRRVYLSTALHKALEALLNDDVMVEPKDAVNIIQLLNNLDNQTQGAQLETIQIQFNAFMVAMKEICPPEMWQAIIDRTKSIVVGTVTVGPREIEETTDDVQ